jgi:hypothetical protein
VQHRRVRVLRRAGVDDRVEWLVVHLHELGSVAGQLARLRDDGHDGLTDVTHLADREREVLDVGARRARDLEERIGGALEIWKNGSVSAATSSPVSVP